MRATYAGDPVSTSSVLRQSCKSSSPVGLVNPPVEAAVRCPCDITVKWRWGDGPGFRGLVPLAQTGDRAAFTNTGRANALLPAQSTCSDDPAIVSSSDRVRVPETRFDCSGLALAGSRSVHLMRLLAVSAPVRAGGVALPIRRRERGGDTRLASRTRGAPPAGEPAKLPPGRSGVPGRTRPAASS